MAINKKKILFYIQKTNFWISTGKNRKSIKLKSNKFVVTCVEFTLVFPIVLPNGAIEPVRDVKYYKTIKRLIYFTKS